MKIYILAVALGLAIGWYNQDVYVQPGRAEVCSDEIKRTIRYMGNKKNYRILEDGTLQVWVKGQWLYLKYK